MKSRFVIVALFLLGAPSAVYAQAATDVDLAKRRVLLLKRPPFPATSADQQQALDIDEFVGQ